jgi:hypothetical protein
MRKVKSRVQTHQPLVNPFFSVNSALLALNSAVGDVLAKTVGLENVTVAQCAFGC